VRFRNAQRQRPLVKTKELDNHYYLLVAVKLRRWEHVLPVVLVLAGATNKMTTRVLGARAAAEWEGVSVRRASALPDS
jgi:hypothetical protein